MVAILHRQTDRQTDRQTNMISHPAFVRAWLGSETGVAEYFRAPVFSFREIEV